MGSMARASYNSILTMHTYIQVEYFHISWFPHFIGNFAREHMEFDANFSTH
jgi:hypothetical protein